MSDPRPNIHRFGPFEIDLDQRLLLRDGNSIPLTPKAFDTLALLLERQGRVIEKPELLKLLWPDTFVEENNLTQNISALRKAFGAQSYIETIPRRGYRFTAPIEIQSPGPVTDLDEPASRVADRPENSRSTWIWIGTTAALILILGVVAYRSIRGLRKPEHQVDSLVVLPIQNFTADPDVDYFSDGMTEELTNALAQLKNVKVVARTTAFQFKGKAQDIRSIAQQVHVTTVLEGSVRRQEKRLRVTMQLNDALTGYHIWSQTFDNDAGDILSVQEEISNQVAARIRPDSASGKASGTRNPAAYKAYLLGRFYRQRSDSDSRKRAIAYFEEAIRKDSRYASAYAGLAEAYTLLAWESDMAPLEAWGPAQKAIEQALSLDPDLAEAHRSQGFVYLQLARNWKAAEQHFRRALALNPNDAEAHHWYSHYLIAMGRISESLTESQRALELDPLDIQISAHLSWHYLRARDYANAVQAGLHTLELDRHSDLAYIFLAWAYEDAGEWDKAINAWQHAGTVHPEASVLRAALRKNGPSGFWMARLAFMLERQPANDYQIALVYARLGEAENTLKRLERAFQLHEPELIYARREPALDGVAANARFKTLAEALKLP